MKQQPEMEVKPGGKSAAEAVSGSEDILDVLALRIDQLAASDSEDDIFSGMFLLVGLCMITVQRRFLDHL